MIRRSVREWLLVVSVAFGLAACSTPEPMLRPNAKLQLKGRDAAQLDVDTCRYKAEDAGLKPDTASRSGNMASGAVIGVVGGAAVGASTGLIGGGAGVAIGAAAGAGLGLIIGLVGGGYKPLDPDPAYADFVVRCLTEKGYDVQGWK
ncbi:hypothetical protein [Petrachloros mirabilis]